MKFYLLFPKKPAWLVAVFIALWVLILATPGATLAQEADIVVRAVLFYSPTCPHCAQVIQQDLPPLFNKYNGQLEMIGLDISQPDGQALYSAAVTAYQIPQERLGVPTLVIDDIVLVGSAEIPEMFPGLVAQYLAQGGVDWPAIPGLAEALASANAAATEAASSAPTAEALAPDNPAATDAASPAPTEGMEPEDPAGLALSDPHNLTWQEKFTRDLAGNTLSVFVLLGMLGALIWAARSNPHSTPVHPQASYWLFLILCLIGFGVAGYLAYVETADVSAVCGPVGDCNTVQQSEYARLFGFLPIGVLGLIGYVLILLAWLITRHGKGKTADFAALSLLAMTLAGTLFSVYLTFLEPFVIGATCAWCLTSAATMTALMLLAVEPGRKALKRLQSR